ncbi:type II toxin-antitoxin system RelE family toxin [Methylovulum miyakonense]|uniref:type II toxin-antitoxin system RelE family toxin n=1 Tax=Methylovulum miyakonense TaxID=645578 RepID=UPI0003726808|nr:type II toxin-antitoxin system RelE/ParE family toxin [Methylovulum miyakonense]
MTWTVKVDDKAAKILKSLDKPQKQRLEAFIDGLQTTGNPRACGKALQGQLAGYWRYRVGDYRIICQIKDGELLILAIEIGHRKGIYR